MPTIIRSDPRAREKPCLRCGYSLRKALDAKHCPQCGLSVWLSLNQNDALDWSKPSWLRRTALGLALMAGSTVLGAAAYAVLHLGSTPRSVALAAVLGGAFFIAYSLALLLAASYEGRHPDRLRSYRVGAMVAAGVGILTGAVLGGTGAMRLKQGWATAPSLLEVQRRVVEDYRRARAAMPATTQAAAAAAAVEPDVTIDPAFEEEALAEAAAAELAAHRGFSGWMLGIELAAAAGMLATFAYLRKLAQRLPHAGAARLCGYLLFLPLLALFKAVPFLTAWIVFMFYRVIYVLPWLYLPFAAGLLAWFAWKLHLAATDADRHWSAESAPA